MSSEIWSVLIGSGISLAASCIVTAMQNRHSLKLTKQNNSFEVQTWIRDKKVEVYVHLASFLDGLPVYVNSDTGQVDGESFVENSRKLTAVIEKYQGEMALFVPPAINRELLYLRAEIYKLSIDEESQRIDYANFSHSEAMKTIMHAKSIFTMMQQDLGIEVSKK